jgi:hypothetical protein
MARDEEARQVEIGFSGGQTIAVRVSHKTYENLRKSVQGGSGWYELESSDGLVALNLAQVLFVRLDTGEHKVGFSGL